MSAACSASSRLRSSARCAVHQLLDQVVLRHLLALDQAFHDLVLVQQLLHIAQVLLQILELEPRRRVVHASFTGFVPRSYVPRWSSCGP